MSRLVVICACVVGLGIASMAALDAQKRPDFAGLWVGVDAPDGFNELIVAQTDTALTVRHGSTPDDVPSYKLDGSETRFQVAAGITVAKAAWEGDKLVITEWTTYPDRRKVERRQVWSIDKAGQLVIELTRPSGRGTEMRTTTTTYRKK